MTKLIEGLVGTGGLLRVRALLVFAFTGIGGGYMLLHQSMPPETFDALWAVSVTYYFATRGAADGGGS